MKRIVLSLILLELVGQVCAQPDVGEIIEKANNATYYQADDGRAVVKMTITDSQGRERHRELIMLRKDVEDGKDQKYYAYFVEPEDVRDMVYIVHKHIDRDDDRWLYLPSLDLVRRVSATDERSSFVGSNFVYEDVSGRGVNEDIHKLLKEDDNYYVIKNTPKNTQNLDFAYWIVYIDKNTFLPVKAEYYDDKDKLFRTIEALELRDIQGFNTIVREKAVDLRNGGNTEIVFEDVDYNIGLSDDIFTERYMRKPPKKWLR